MTYASEIDLKPPPVFSRTTNGLHKAQLEPYFKEMMDTLCDVYSEQTNTTYKIVWKNPNKKGYRFQIIIHLNIDDNLVNGDSVSTVMEDIQRYLDTRPTPLQEEVPFLYRVVIR